VFWADDTASTAGSTVSGARHARRDLHVGLPTGPMQSVVLPEGLPADRRRNRTDSVEHAIGRPARRWWRPALPVLTAEA